ncbi:probable WRKY transcription factor 43 [Coffea arabica]
MFMEEGSPIAAGNNVPYLFTPTLSSTAPLYPPLLMNQSMQSPQIASDMDWATILSSTAVNCEQKPTSPCLSMASRNAREGDNLDKNKVKPGKTKKCVPPRIAFHTRSTEDILDDGYKWRKYGQKAVKNCAHPRSYYRCTHHTCNVKKQIQRLSKDTSIVVTTYEGIHNHPCEKLMETLSPLLKQLQFLSRF